MPERFNRRASVCAVATVLVLGIVLSRAEASSATVSAPANATANATNTTPAVAATPAAAPASGKSAPWSTLSAAQKTVLGPLEKDWSSIDATRQRKWLELAGRFPSLPAAEQARIKARMAEWSRLSPAQRGQARQQFQEARDLPTEQRQAKWREYQALSPDQRQALAQQAKPAARAQASKDANEQKARQLADDDGPNAKRNLVQAPSAPPAKVVGNLVVQAKPGATTTRMNVRAAPPAHHQPGLPKIAATPGFVDPATLLPKRGPQGAAVQSAAASAPSSAP